jgi:penicillin-binding protein 2
MASLPTFDPSQFIGGISTELWESLTSDDSGYPLNNRAIAGSYPAASTFKAFTGMAGLQYGVITSSTIENCSGVWTGFGTAYAQKCWLTTGHGNVDLEEAIQVSCDIYFYNVAKGFYDLADEDETMLQDYLMTWGFGSKTGVDISGEAAGRVPTPAWKSAYYWDDPEDGQWYPGDMSNLIIGQGDVLVTPLQEASAFGCMAIGERYTPHLLKEVLNTEGDVSITYSSKLTSTQPDYTDENIGIMRANLRNANYYSDAFQDTTLVAAGKSGTGETGSSDKDDYGWYTGYAPYDDPKYCVSCCIEQAGGGTAFCGPVVRYILCKLLGINEEKIDLVELKDDH